MILRGWMVLVFGFFLGAIAGYLTAAFVAWDLLFFTPPEGEPGTRIAMLFAMTFCGCVGCFPFIGWSVDVDMQNRRQR